MSTRQIRNLFIFLIIISFTAIGFSQSILETKTGMNYIGKFIEIDSTYIVFKPTGIDNQQRLPRKIVKRVILENGKIQYKSDTQIKEDKYISQEEYKNIFSNVIHSNVIHNVDTTIKSQDEPPIEKTQLLDSLNAMIIYRYAYKTAMRDSKINHDEKAILKSLERTLELSQKNIFSIQNQILLTSRKVLDQSGRWPLVLQNIGWGAGLYGWAIPFVLDVQDYKWVIGTEMMSFAGSFY